MNELNQNENQNEKRNANQNQNINTNLNENDVRIYIDTHTHSMVSNHAFSTVSELAEGAAKKGLYMFVLTDHGPSLPDGAHPFYFGNLKVLPQEINGVKILKGAEANIIDYEGRLDLEKSQLKRLEFVLASFHDVCLRPSTIDNITNAAIGALKNPFVDALAHPGNPTFTMDIDRVVDTAAMLGKMIEVNNHSFISRPGSHPNCLEFARKCAIRGVRIIISSDAHIKFDIGNFSKALAIVKEAGVPEHLILNASIERFENYLKEREARCAAAAKVS